MVWHVVRQDGSLTKIIMEGTVRKKEKRLDVSWIDDQRTDQRRIQSSGSGVGVLGAFAYYQ